MLLPGNTKAAQPSDGLYDMWKSFQDNIDSRSSLPYYYTKPYPIIKLELYGFDGYNSGPNTPMPPNPMLPTVNDNVITRPVTSCDHVVVRGLYVVDHGHTMYGSYGGSFESNRGPWVTGILHAELHPYTWNSVNLINPPQPSEPYSERHTLVVPCYYQGYKETNLSGFFGQTGPVDDTKINIKDADWYIQKPPQPTEGCYGGCHLAVEQNIINKKGNVNVDIAEESSSVHVHGYAEAPYIDIVVPFLGIQRFYTDYEPMGGFNGCSPRDLNCIYTIPSPSLYDERFTLQWYGNTMNLGITPSTIIAKLPTSIIVHAEDSQNHNPINGKIIINDSDVGRTDIPFTYTFNSSHYSAKVVAPNYPETYLNFHVNNSLEIQSVPDTINLFLNHPSKTNITVFAKSLATHQPVEGKILISNKEYTPYTEIGNTNVLFQYEFKAYKHGAGVCAQYTAPKVIAVATGYDNTKVPIIFSTDDVASDDCYHGPLDDGGGGGGGPPYCDMVPTELRPQC
jgi:hypothetical protein